MRLFGNPVQGAALILSAIALAACFHSQHLGFLAWIAMVPIALVVESRVVPLVPAYLSGVLLQLMGVEWMLHYYSTMHLNRSRTLNWLMVGLILGAVLPLVLLMGSHLRQRGWPLAFALAIAWTTGDFLRYQLGWLISGSPYPWLNLALTQPGSVMQVADLGGIWAISFAAALIGGLPAMLFLKQPSKLVACFVTVVFLYGIARQHESESGPRIALMPAQSLDVPSSDIALWSEAIWPYEPISPDNTVYVAGMERETEHAIYNSIVVSQSGKVLGYYDKCNLVPWAEYTPWPFAPGYRSFTSGSTMGVFECRSYRMATAICYDICFPGFIRQAHTADFLVVSASESSDPTKGLARQLLQFARIRAIEIRRAVVRNADGGFSGVVDGNGSISVVSIATPTTMSIPIDRRFSLYAYLGDLLPAAGLIVFVPSLKRFPCWAINRVRNKLNRAVTE